MWCFYQPLKLYQYFRYIKLQQPADINYTHCKKLSAAYENSRPFVNEKISTAFVCLFIFIDSACTKQTGLCFI
jgi:hypothetical protein